MGIPENIDALLEKFDITQETLARIAGVSPSSVSHWRRGQVPRMAAVDRICEHFGLAWDDIMTNSFGLAAKETAWRADLQPGESIANNVKRFRESKGMTQEEFGNVAGVSAMAVSQWENGRAVPRMGALERIAEFFNAPKGDIIDGREKRASGIAENIKALRQTLGVTQRELAEVAGVTENAVSKWETGYSVPRMGTIERIATHYGIAIRSIVDDGGAGIPLLARPRTCDEDGPQAAEGLMPVPYEVWRDHPNGYFLKAEGRHMNKLYPEGSLILVDPDVEPSSGSIVVVSIDGADYVMRRLYKGSSVLVLSPDSWEEGYEDIVISGSDHTVEFVGSVVWFQASGELE